MILLFEIKAINKDIRVKGCLTAKTRVRRGLYDVSIGDDRFPSLVVSEPHINSPVPQRGIDIECGPDAFRLESVIRSNMTAGDFVITCTPVGDVTSHPDPRDSQFHLTPRDWYVYVTMHGALFERSAGGSDGTFWVLTRMTGGDQKNLATKSERHLMCEERGPLLHYLAAHALLRVEITPRNLERALSEDGSEVPLALANGTYGQLRRRGDQLEMTFADQSDLTDSVATLLTSGHRCLIPLGISDSDSAQKHELAPEENREWIKVGF